jgi:hypothetical protein
MRYHIRSSIALLVTLGFSATALHAADKTTSPPAPPRDPFLKERGAPNAAPDLTGAITSITTIFEVYNLTQDDAVSLFTSPPDPTARYRRITELTKAGRARLEDVEASAGKSGQRALMESVDMVPLALEFQPLSSTDSPLVPVAYETNQFGDRLEIEPILSPDAKTCTLNFMVDDSAARGTQELRTSPKAPPRGYVNSENRCLITSLAIKTDVPVLVGTASRPASSGVEAEVSVVFAQVGVSNERPAKAAPPLGVIAYSEYLLMFYSVERSAAVSLLTENTAPGACFAAVQSLAAKKEAKLEHTLLLPAQAGVTAKADENLIARQPIILKPGPTAQGGRPGEAKAKSDSSEPVHVTELGKNVGLSVELQSVVGPPDAAIKGFPLVADVTNSIAWRANAGVLDTGAPSGNFPEVMVQESRKLQNEVPCYVSVPTFLGTLNPPPATGVNQRKDTGRVWLAFLLITPVAP